MDDVSNAVFTCCVLLHSFPTHKRQSAALSKFLPGSFNTYRFCFSRRQRKSSYDLSLALVSDFPYSIIILAYTEGPNISSNQSCIPSYNSLFEQMYLECFQGKKKNSRVIIKISKINKQKSGHLPCLIYWFNPHSSILHGQFLQSSKTKVWFF